MICETVLERQRWAIQNRAQAIADAVREHAQREATEERQAEPLCVVCFGPAIPANHKGQWRLICDGCHARGYVGVPCRGCGGKLTRTDQTGPSKPWRNYCKVCRLDIQDMEAVKAGARKLMRRIHESRGYDV